MEERQISKAVIARLPRYYRYLGELMEEGIEVLGASSDHTIIDVEDAARDFKVGDIMTFDVCYATLVYLTSSRNVRIVYV